MFLFESEVREKADIPTQRQSGKKGFCLTLPFFSSQLIDWGLQVIGRGPPIMGKTISFTQSTNLKVYLFHKNLHRNTQKKVGSNIWAPHDLFKPTHKINHHNDQ